MEHNEVKMGIIGLGKRGGNFALQAAEKGISVAGKDKSGVEKELSHLKDKGVNVVDSYEDLVDFLDAPRVFYLLLPAGPTVDRVLEELAPRLDKCDVVIDGSNSFYLDSIRREEDLADLGIYFLDCGTCGGLKGARNGACFMLGGRIEGVKVAEPILKSLAANGSYVYTGDPGSGHFVKLVHDGIELGMCQAIGEGTALLRGADYNLNLSNVIENWCQGSMINGRLLESMAESLKENRFEELPSYVEDTGQANWLVHDAIEKEIAIPVIAQSVMELFRSRDREGDAYRSIGLMKKATCGNPLGKNAEIMQERISGRVEKI